MYRLAPLLVLAVEPVVFRPVFVLTEDVPLALIVGFVVCQINGRVHVSVDMIAANTVNDNKSVKPGGAGIASIDNTDSACRALSCECPGRGRLEEVVVGKGRTPVQFVRALTFQCLCTVLLKEHIELGFT